MAEGLITGMEKVRNLFHGMVVRGLQRSDTGPQQLAHILILHLVEVLEVEDLPLAVWQACDGLLEQLFRLVAIEVGVALQSRRDSHRRLVVQTRLLAIAFEEVQGLVVGDAEQPGAQLRVTSEIIQPCPSLDERVLQHVVGIIMGEDHTSDLPIELLLEVLHQHRKSALACAFIAQLVYDLFLIPHKFDSPTCILGNFRLQR